MLLLVIPQTYASAHSPLIWDFILSLVYKDYILINWVLGGLKKSNSFWLGSALVQAELIGAFHATKARKYLTIIYKCQELDRFTVPFRYFT